MSRPVLPPVTGLDELVQIKVPRVGALWVISSPQGAELFPVRESLIGEVGIGLGFAEACRQIEGLAMIKLRDDLCANRIHQCIELAI